MVLAAVLCTLVTRDQQYSLSKVSSALLWQSALNVSRIECGKWASLPEEAWKPRVYLHLRTRGGSGPPGGVSVPSQLRGPDSIWGSGTPWEVQGPRLFWVSAPFSGTRGVTGPFPSKGRVRGH